MGRLPKIRGSGEASKLKFSVRAESVDALIKIIMDVAHFGAAGSGVVAVMPVERFFRVRSQPEAVP
jgi:nitrogen regulatory protein PII